MMPLPAITAYPLCARRVHEACGPGAVGFAVRTAAQMADAVLWLQEDWALARINPLGFEGLDPARLILVRTQGQTDTLTVAEEALRDGGVGLVVLQLSAALSLTAGRRLQLAAAAGGAIGLCLIPEGMGSPAAETRWHCAPVFDPVDSTRQCWTLTKNKAGKTGQWHVRWDAEARHVQVVSSTATG